MKHLLYYNADGCITRTTGLPDGVAPDPRPDERYLVFDEYQDPTGKHISHGRLIPFPPQPSTAHEWDWTRKLWIYRPAIAARQVRQQRDGLLATCDWTQLPDVPLRTQAAWAVYRQALRDLSTQPGFPEDVTWPRPPL